MDSTLYGLNSDRQGLNFELAIPRLSLTAKRTIDFFGSLLILLFLLPLLLLVAIMVRCSSRGPVFYVQSRVGYRGRNFRLYKFRTMIVDQDHCAEIQRVKQLARQGILLKLKNDSRITPIGRILRRTSIDELPQLLNVLKGEMSLVGPRPLAPFLLDPYPEFSRIRSLVKPGITGLWQIRARELNTNAAYMMEHDVEYIRRFGFRLDLAILLRTIPVCLSGKGAY